MFKRQRGFTLIELLVVIAIIGILSSVVLASLNTARDKGADAAIKANLNGVRAQAELFYDTNGTYDAVCTTDDNVSRAVSESGGACADSDDGWTATGLLSTDDYYCTDSTGNATTTGTGVTDGADWADGTHDCASL